MLHPLHPSALALIALTDSVELGERMHKEATDAQGEITIHSATQYLLSELIKKHAVCRSTQLELQALREVSDATV